MSRRAKGEGCIRKRKDGRWEGLYTVGYNVRTGKIVRKSVYGKTQAEVRDKLAKAIREYLGSAYKAPSVSQPTSQPAASGKLYRVQVGAFAVNSNAEKLQKDLKAKGYSAIIV